MFLLATNQLTCILALYYNGVLYIHGGVQTFNVPEHATNWTNNTLGYSE
jgi:hypothetical protein